MHTGFFLRPTWCAVVGLGRYFFAKEKLCMGSEAEQKLFTTISVQRYVQDVAWFEFSVCLCLFVL